MTDDPAVTAPLAQFEGRRPPAPAWFTEALERQPDRFFVEVRGASIETLTWGERGHPGVLFLHGNAAHAGWWSAIAPFFGAEFRVAAISWSGMGRSDWRERYSIECYGEEALRCAEAAGLFEAEEPPFVVAHSFGTAPALRFAATHGECVKGLVVLDSGIWPPGSGVFRPPEQVSAHRIYPSIGEALTRFRLSPMSRCDNHFILDFIAREAIKRVALNGGEGWTWRSDPAMRARLDRSTPERAAQDLAGLRCKLALVVGELSGKKDSEMMRYTLQHAPPDTLFFAIPGAAHHIMLDQPLALVAALRALFVAWKDARPRVD